MLVKSTYVYRQIIDHGSVTASGVSSLLVEKLSKKIDRDELKLLVQAVSAAITKSNNTLIDNLQKEEHRALSVKSSTARIT